MGSSMLDWEGAGGSLRVRVNRADANKRRTSGGLELGGVGNFPTQTK
jgi:hypothetical protein